eukprot:3377073-Pleurochrysis_carterae.AAC.2
MIADRENFQARLACSISSLYVATEWYWCPHECATESLLATGRALSVKRRVCPAAQRPCRCARARQPADGRARSRTRAQSSERARLCGHAAIRLLPL